VAETLDQRILGETGDVLEALPAHEEQADGTLTIAKTCTSPPKRDGA
jgi:hypothetical protein